jgi:hypothetical protein
MTTAVTFNQPARIIQYAMEDAGLLQTGDEPKSEHYAKYTNRLNDIINFLGTQGIKLWTQTDTSVTLVAGQTTYNFTPGGDVNMTKPLRVLQGYYNDANSNRSPLVVLSRDEYTRLSQVSASGAVNSYFVDKQASLVAVSFWLTPDSQAATGTAHVILQGQIANFTGVTDTMNFPQEWFIALRWLLADDICTGQPQAIMDRCMAKATAYRQMLEDWDVEDAPTSFAPDQRSLYYSGKFR